jgi:2,3-bisphosphoglycerate-independent phosphoglycerate mutase
MKYAVLIGDGMGDYPIPELGGTPLEIAYTPNMDEIARKSVCGVAQTIPNGMPKGSDVANMSIFGYDPKEYYTGRGPIEAAGLGVPVKRGDVAFRCNLITVEGGIITDYSAGHINTHDAEPLIKALD